MAISSVFGVWIAHGDVGPWPALPTADPAECVCVARRSEICPQGHVWRRGEPAIAPLHGLGLHVHDWSRAWAVVLDVAVVAEEGSTRAGAAAPAAAAAASASGGCRRRCARGTDAVVGSRTLRSLDHNTWLARGLDAI